jgi:galactose mutarotase-like enzyme
MNSIRSGRYKNEEAIVLENDTLKVSVLPRWGSKLASILYKPLGHELLWQNPGKEYRKTVYGDPYDRGEASGFDEMFPTITRCFYEKEPWSGTEMPDHGEVWSVPWEYALAEDQVQFRVKGLRFPYYLAKTVSLEESTLRFHYRVENLSEADFDYIWAAHPLFNAVQGMELIVPKGMNRIVNAVPSKRLGPYGRIYGFPSAELEGGASFDLSRMPKKYGADYQKYWFLGKLTEGWCILYDPERRLNIGMAWPGDRVSYLGVWVNEGGWEDQYNIAPEPATGAMDRVDFSKIWGVGSVLRAGEVKEWQLHLSLHQGERVSTGPL